MHVLGLAREISPTFITLLISGTLGQRCDLLKGLFLECLVSSAPKIQSSELLIQALRRICPAQEGFEVQEFWGGVRDVPSQGWVWPRLTIGFKSDGFRSSLVLLWGQQGGGVRGDQQGRNWGV